MPGMAQWGAFTRDTQPAAPISSSLTSSIPQTSRHQPRGVHTGGLTLGSIGSTAGRQGPSTGQEPSLVEDVLQVLQLLLLQQCRRLPALAEPLADVLLSAEAPGGLGDLQLECQVPLQGAQRVLGTEGTRSAPHHPPSHLHTNEGFA